MKLHFGLEYVLPNITDPGFWSPDEVRFCMFVSAVCGVFDIAPHAELLPASFENSGWSFERDVSLEPL